MNDSISGKTISVCTLGCRVNQYESDSVCAELKKLGIVTVPFGDKADVTLINTCTVTAESDRKSRQMIRRAAQFTENIVVTGCYVQTTGADDTSASPNVVYVCGNSGKAELPRIITNILSGNKPSVINCVTPPDSPSSVNMMLCTPMRTRSYIKIEDGCQNRCAYCLISTARGPVRSKSPETVVKEAKALAELGAKEVILTGIETASYGMDFASRKPYGYSLADLIEAVAEIDGIERIGLGSVDPTVMTDYFAEKAAKCSKLLPHFHLSVQSGSNRVLASMRRKYTSSKVLECAARMRSARPDVTFSADVITGFPGETDADFEASAALCETIGFLHLHVFPYSKREGTEAETMPNQVPEDIKHRRAELLSESGAKTKAAILSDYVESHRDKPIMLLVEKNPDGICSGHSEHFVEIKGVPSDANVGDIIPVLLTDTDGDICTGKLAGRTLA